MIIQTLSGHFSKTTSMRFLRHRCLPGCVLSPFFVGRSKTENTAACETPRCFILWSAWNVNHTLSKPNTDRATSRPGLYSIFGGLTRGVPCVSRFLPLPSMLRLLRPTTIPASRLLSLYLFRPGQRNINGSPLYNGNLLPFAPRLSRARHFPQNGAADESAGARANCFRASRASSTCWQVTSCQPAMR